MGCGLKKQNTETGVHLTERTCSPYNPIIKQIVDDCLGLPIYPVTSVDAVIDEEGNTLRKLLEDGIGVNSEELINYINSKLLEVSQTYVTSNQFTTLVNQTLPDTYADKNVVNTLKTLVWAISALSNIRVDNEDDLYDNDDKTPRIVKAVTELQSQMRSILGQGSGDAPSLGQLSAAVDLLEEVLVAVANLNEDYSTTNNSIGLDTPTLKIVSTILEIRSDIGDLSDNNLNISGNIIQRINYIYNNLGVLRELVSTEILNLNDIIGVRQGSSTTIAQDITTIKSQIGIRGTDPTIAEDIEDILSDITTINETLIKKANLDPELLELCSNIAGDALGKYKKLKASEYPITSIYIFGSEVINFLTDPEDTTKRMFVYFPSGTKLGAETGGGTLNFDFNEDGCVNWRDVAIYNEFKLKINSTGSNFNDVIDQIGCSETFRNPDYWHVDNDGLMGTLGDLNALIDLVLSGSGFTYLNNPTQTAATTSLDVSKGCTRYIFEIIRNTPVDNEYPAYNAPSNIDPDNVINAVKNIYMGINEYSAVEGQGAEYFKVVAHRAIDGKLYFDLGTNAIYRYRDNPNDTGVMLSTREEDMICRYLGTNASSRLFRSGENVVTAKVNRVLAKPSLSTAGNYENGTGLNASDFKYSIADVTALINFLLSAPETSGSNRKINVAASTAFDLQNIKAGLIRTENVSGDTVLSNNYNLDDAWSQALTRQQKALTIVNAIRLGLSEFEISDTDVSISQIKAALSGSNIPYGNYESYPKPTVTPNPDLTLSPTLLLGSNSGDWEKLCYILKEGITALWDIPLEGLVYTDTLVAKHDIDLDGVASIADVTILINLLLSGNTTVLINKVYYNYTVGVITNITYNEEDQKYYYITEEVKLHPGKKVYLIDKEAEADPNNNYILKYKRSYIDYDNCLLPDLDDYHLGLTVTGWTTLEHNGLIVDIVRTPIFLDLSTNKVGLIQGDKTIYFTINGNTADISVTDTLYNYGGEQL